MRKVVNISSTSGVNGNAGQSNYSAGKAGIVGLTKTLAKEFGRYDVTVNAVAFGYIQTRLTKPLTQGEAGEIEVQGRKVKIGVQGGRIAAMNQMIPLGRGGLPEEAAGSVYLFCSPDSDYVSGQCLVVNGGLTGGPLARVHERAASGGPALELGLYWSMQFLGPSASPSSAAACGPGARRCSPRAAIASRSSSASPSRQPIGAGLLLQPTGLAVLRELGLADAAIARGARVVGLEARTHRGRAILDLHYADLHPLAHGVGIHRATLFDLLHGRLQQSPAKLVTGAEIVDVDTDAPRRQRAARATARSISSSWPTARTRRCARG